MPELQHFVFVLLSGVSGLLLTVTIVRFIDALRTSRWPAVEGRVTASHLGRSEHGRPGAQQDVIETAAQVTYEYSVSGEIHRGHRITRFPPPQTSDVLATLARYPMGSAVTVHYNPAKPSDAVLELEPLRLSAERLASLAVFTLVVILATIYGLTPLHGIVERYFPHADNENVLVLATGMGGAILLFSLVWLRDSVREARWPTASGSIVTSRVESFKTVSAGRSTGAVTVTMYRPAVEYRYNVGDQQYSSNRIRREQEAGGEPQARQIVERYPVGSAVQVRYNPANPSESILETSFGAFVILLLVAAAMFAIAASQSGLFGL